MNIIKTKISNIKKDFRDFSKNVNWTVFILIIIFAPTSWLNVNSILSELPNMIPDLPEGWRVPSTISALTQFAQLVPLFYLLAKWIWPNKITHQKFIYVLMVINLITCFFLSFFWNKTLSIANEKRSFGLYFLSFISALISN